MSSGTRPMTWTDAPSAPAGGLPWLPRGVVRLGIGSRVALWNRATGRHFTLPTSLEAQLSRWTPAAAPPLALRAVVARLRDLGLVEPLAEDQLTALRPCRSALTLLLPARPALWHPVPGARTAGGFAYAALTLTDAERALWQAFNGSRTVRQVGATVGVPASDVLAFLARLTHEGVQAAQLRAHPPRPQDAALGRILAPERPRHARTADQHGASGETTLGAWHQRIDRPSRHFDDREITAAHVFARCHAALGGRPYGARLLEVFRERGLLPGADGAVVEVGAGDGELGRDFYAAWGPRPPDAGPALRVDASPALLALQAARQPHTRGLHGDASALPLPADSVDLLFSNEVLADLTAVPVAALGGDAEASRAAAARMARYGLAAPPAGSFVNLGAWTFVEEIARVLRPGGVAWLSEFGARDEVPTETAQLDHPEVSIHFGHLEAVGVALGLEVSVERLDRFLGADLQARWLRRAHFDALRALADARGQHLEARAWTAATVPTAEPVEGLLDGPVAQDGPGPVLTRFLCVTLRKPAASGAAHRGS